MRTNAPWTCKINYGLNAGVIRYNRKWKTCFHAGIQLDLQLQIKRGRPVPIPMALSVNQVIDPSNFGWDVNGTHVLRIRSTEKFPGISGILKR